VDERRKRLGGVRLEYGWRLEEGLKKTAERAKKGNEYEWGRKK
jgi:hypothetical protein